jgi:exonuclease III
MIRSHIPICARRNNWITSAPQDERKWGVATTALSGLASITAGETILEGRITKCLFTKGNTKINLLNCYFPPTAAGKTEAIEAICNSQYTEENTIMIGDLNIIDDKRDAWPHKTSTNHPNEPWQKAAGQIGMEGLGPDGTHNNGKVNPNQMECRTHGRV